MLYPKYPLIIVIFPYYAESGSLLFSIMTCKITDQCTKVDSSVSQHYRMRSIIFQRSLLLLVIATSHNNNFIAINVKHDVIPQTVPIIIIPKDPI